MKLTKIGRNNLKATVSAAVGGGKRGVNIQFPKKKKLILGGELSTGECKHQQWITSWCGDNSQHHSSNIHGNSNYFSMELNAIGRLMRNYSVHTSPNKGNKDLMSKVTGLRNELVPVTLNCIKYKYENGIPLTMLTATDYHSSNVVDQTNCDMILVGDSLSMTALGQSNTTTVTMDEMIHHAKAVKRGSQYSFLIGDMPFGSYVTDDLAVQNAVRFIKEGEMNSVKLEGGERVASKIKSIVDAGIVVIAHIGLTPQSCNQLGGFRVVGSKNCSEAIQVWKDALAVKEAGASLIVLECVPQKLASLITKYIGIPTIGIGSGQCSGQVLVFHDILGMYSKFTPKFCKQYLNLNPVMIDACERYVKDVVEGEFPQKSHTFIIKDDVYKYVSEFIEKDVKERLPNEEKSFNQVVPKKNESIPRYNYNNLSEKAKIVVVGSGSVGSLLSMSLFSSESDLRIVKGRHSEFVGNEIEIERNININGEIKHGGKKTIQYLSDVELKNDWNGEVDVLMICVKSYATREAIQNMLKQFPSLSNVKHIITVQNGIGNDETILKEFTNGKLEMENVSILPINIYSGVKTIETVEAKCMVIQQANSEKVSFSIPKVLQETQLGNLFMKNSNFELHSTTIPTLIDGKDRFVDWMKFIVNSTVNPIAALHRVENGDLRQNEHLQNLIQLLIKEQVGILRMIPSAIDSLATFQELKVNPIEKILFDKVMTICELTKSNRCSMLVDVESNNETEIENLNGAFVDLAKRLKVEAPYNQMIVELVKALNKNQV